MLKRAKAVNRQISLVLILQATIPLFLAFVPMVTNPLCTILIIKEYRSRVLGQLRCRSNAVTSVKAVNSN
uniref:G protein-coupled receptor n=1 Tax=Ditylenchus dipsaci TaxID=166011 RepID=A0A915EMW3_9BILA